MKIKKLQGGGFASFTPIVQTMPGAAVKPKETEEEDSDSIVDKDIYKHLISSGGLVNDVNAFVAELEKIESTSNPYLKSGNRTSVLRLMAKVNELTESKGMWESAISKAKDSGGLGEVAVDNHKNMYIKDGNNKIKAISFADYHKSKSKPRVLTVSELMTARQYDPSLTGNKQIFDVANNSVGVQSITDHIQKMMSLLSEASHATERHYSKKQVLGQLQQEAGKQPSERDQEAVRDLQTLLATPGDYYKVVSKNKSKRGNIDRALNYMWSTLSKESQIKLEATAALNGEKNPKALIYDMLYTYTEPTTESNISPETPQQVHGTKKDTNEKGLTPFQLFHNDKLSDPLSTFAFNDPQLGVMFRGSVGATGPLMTEKGQSIPMSTLNNVLKGAGLDRLVDSQSVHFGNKKIGIENRNNVIYDGETAAKVYMPVGNDGMPDYAEFDNFKEVYSQYETNKEGMSSQQAENFFRKNGYNLQIDQQGNEKVIRANAFIKPFLVMYGYTNDATGLTDDNGQIKKLSKNEKNSIEPLLNQVWTVGQGKSAVDYTPDASWNREDYYKGIITIPYKKDAAAYASAIVGQGALESQPHIGVVQNNIRNSSNQGGSITSDASVLNTE